MGLSVETGSDTFRKSIFSLKCYFFPFCSSEISCVALFNSGYTGIEQNSKIVINSTINLIGKNSTSAMLETQGWGGGQEKKKKVLALPSKFAHSILNNKHSPVYTCEKMTFIHEYIIDMMICLHRK